MLEVLVALVMILALVALNGFFVAAEFAIIAAPRAAMAARAETGEGWARRIAETLDDPPRLDRYVATAQLGISVASLGLGMYGEHSLAAFFRDWLAAAGLAGPGLPVTAHGLATVLALLCITYLHIVFGEMIPKALALNDAVRVALWVVPPMLLLGRVFYPLVRGLNLTGTWLLRLVGVERGRGAAHYFAPTEIESLARESQESGLISEESGRIFLELADFSEISAVQAMVPRVRTNGIPSDASDALLRETLLRTPHTRFPVYRGDLDEIVGTLHIKDLLGLIRNGSGLDPAAIRETAYVPETATLDDVLAAMDRVHNQMVVVMDEHGGTAGILTMEDICAEAVGDMEEGADDVPDVLPVGVNRYQVQGTVRLDTLGAVIGWDLDHEEVDTVSGLILSELGRPPLTGDEVRWNGLSLRVTSLHGRGVRQAVVSLQTQDPMADDGPQDPTPD